MASGVKHNFGQSFAAKSLASLNNNQGGYGINNGFGQFGPCLPYGRLPYGQPQAQLRDPDGSLAMKLAEQARKAGFDSIADRYEQAVAKLKEKNADKTSASTEEKTDAQKATDTAKNVINLFG